MSDDPWHYPRDDLAERVLLSLTEGPAKALTLFAPRRRGKTEFIRKDVAPLARSRKHTVVYVSFWNPLDPLPVLIAELEKAVAGSGLKGRASAVAGAIATRIKLSAEVPGIGASGELDLTDVPQKAKIGLVAHLDTLLGRLEREGRKTILLLDEVQELARREGDSGLVAGLRTSLDVRDGLRTIFTGSSREGLRAMFGASKAPFFHFGSQIDLPEMDEGFVRHQLARLAKVSKAKVKRSDAMDAFEALGRSPYHFRRVMDVIVLVPELTVAKAIEKHREQLAEAQGYEAVWLGLTPLRRAVLARLATSDEGVFTAGSVAAIGEALRRPAGTSGIQNALRYLQREGILDRWDREWRFADDEFRVWINGERITERP